MLCKIQNKIEQELKLYLRDLDKQHSLRKISPLLYKNICDFILRKGKRLRPTLFVIGYLGFTKKPAANLYKSALALELVHDFLLVHDDIIDRSDLRRGKPSMHSMLNKYLKGYKGIKFNGEELAIVVGDVMYAMGIHAFLSVKEKPALKEKALKKLIETSIYTASGEFIEILYGIKDIEEINREDIYRIYDYKTAYYTFACPLSMGAILAGAAEKETDKLFNYGVYLGRAFQIKDDILSMFSSENEIDKSILTDLQQAKKTLLIWHAYRNSTGKNKLAIKRIFSKNDADETDLFEMRRIISKAGSLDYTKEEVSKLTDKATALISYSKIRPRYKDFLFEYSRKLLSI